MNTAPVCRLCHGRLEPALTASDRNRRISRQRFAYDRCLRCGTVQLTDPPPDLGRYYPSSYYSPARDRETLLARSAPERYKLELVRRFAPAGRLVEIGPAVGGFLVVMQEAGYDCEAIEMDAECCRYLRQVVGIRATQSDDPSAVLPATPTYDVIALWHVIEHVSDPVHVLAAAAAALRPGGVIALATPNPESLSFRLLGTRWAHLDAPRHLSLIPSSQLSRLAGELGLDVALDTTRDPGSIQWNLFGWRESLAGSSGRPRARQGLRIVGSVMTRAIAPLERCEGWGSTYTLILRRSDEAQPVSVTSAT